MRTAACVALLTFSAVSFAPPVPKTPVGGFFVLDDCDPEFRGKAAYEDNLSCFDRAGKLQFRVGGFNVAGGIGCNRRVAVDPSAKAVWVLEDGTPRVRKFDFTGKELLSLPGIKANALAVDPDTGNLWVLRSTGTIYGSGTAVYARDGKHLADHEFGGWDIAYDGKSKSFWVAGKHLHKVGASEVKAGGDRRVQADIAGWCAACVTVNQKTGQVWVVTRQHSPGLGEDRLLGFDNEGKPNVNVSLSTGDERNYPYHASVDSKTGAVWIAMMRHEVRRFTAEGKPDGQFKYDARAVLADEMTGGAWVITKAEIVRVSGKGEAVQRIKHKGPTDQAWVCDY